MFDQTGLTDGRQKQIVEQLGPHSSLWPNESELQQHNQQQAPRNQVLLSCFSIPAFSDFTVIKAVYKALV